MHPVLLPFLVADPILLAPASEANLDHDLRILVGEDPLPDGPIRSRHIEHPDIHRAETWLFDALVEIDGLEVHREALDGSEGLDNLIAELPGSEPDAAPIVLTAHYDSTAERDPEGTWNPATDPAPGADDNASGVSALLESARILSGSDVVFRRTIRFVFFTAEEVGLVGSRLHVDQLVDRGESVELVLNLDPVGYNPAESYVLWSTFDARWPETADAFEQAAVDIDSILEVTAIDEALMGGDERSDHFPFWEAGFPALHWGSFPQPLEYHTTSDTLDVVDPSFLLAVTDLVTHMAATAAEPEPERPLACACTTMTPATSWLLVPLALFARRRRD